MFDEMPMSRKSGCIQGFEGLGSHGRTDRIANHALVFMLPVYIKSGRNQ
jgi:hypothetical protein